MVAIVETVREFTSFGYQLTLTSVPAPSQTGVEVRIGGITLPTVGRPQPGPARGRVESSTGADGLFDIVVTRKKQRATCRCVIDGGAIESLQAIDEGGLATFEIGSR